MLSIAHTGVSNNVDWEDTVRILGVRSDDEIDDSGLVGVGLKWERVGAGNEFDIGHHGSADRLTVDRHVHRNVTEIEGHDRGVEDIGLGEQIWCAEVCVVGDDREIGDIEAGKLVQTLHCDDLVVIHLHRGKTAEMKLGLAVHVDIKSFTGQNSGDIVSEGFHVCDFEARLRDCDVGNLV